MINRSACRYRSFRFFVSPRIIGRDKCHRVTPFSAAAMCVRRTQSSSSGWNEYVLTPNTPIGVSSFITENATVDWYCGCRASHASRTHQAITSQTKKIRAKRNTPLFGNERIIRSSQRLISGQVDARIPRDSANGLCLYRTIGFRHGFGIQDRTHAAGEREKPRSRPARLGKEMLGCL